MLSRIPARTIVLLVLIAASCRSEPDRAPNDSTPQADPVFMVFVEQTEDVAAWHDRYRANAESRATRGMSEVLSAEDMDRPGTVMVIQSVEDPEEALVFLGSDAAVLGASGATTLRMMELGPMPENPVAIVVVRNRVDDIDEWRGVFERGTAARTEAGLHLAGIGRDIEDEAEIFQAYFATDLEAAREWATSDPAEAMTTSGAPDAPEPSIRFVDPIN